MVVCSRCGRLVLLWALWLFAVDVAGWCCCGHCGCLQQMWQAGVVVGTVVASLLLITVITITTYKLRHRIGELFSNVSVLNSQHKKLHSSSK